MRNLDYEARKLFSYDTMYLDIAFRAAEQSYAFRRKVGMVVVKDDNIIGYGWNGQPENHSNLCEYRESDGSLVTLPSVLHAEENAYRKISKHGASCFDHTAYLTLSPCISCAKIARSNGIKRLVYFEKYRNTEGLDYLTQQGVDVIQIDHAEYTRPTFNTKRTISDEDLLRF